MIILLKTLHQFDVTHINKNPNGLLQGQILLKFIRNHKTYLIVKAILRKNMLDMLPLTLYYKTTVIKQCGTRIKADIQTKGIELRILKQARKSVKLRQRIQERKLEKGKSLFHKW